MGLFKPAVKEAAKLRMAITGPSGSGKTYTALAIATALGGPVAVVDTEHGSASKYADLFSFDVAEMHAPFHPDKFISALNEAQQAGYAVVILDSISHAWSGTGGVLDVVDEAAKRSKSGNTYTAWKEGTPIQNRMIDAIVQSGVHVIVTMRSKTEYVLQDDGRGRQVPRKVGMAPVQRDQFEYEFDVVFDMDIENNAIVSKTRCPELAGRVFSKPGRDVAGILSAWLGGTPLVRTQKTSRATQPTSNGANGAQGASVQATGDAEAAPNTREAKLLAKWRTPEDAQKWAMQLGTCANEFEARNSWKKQVEAAGEFNDATAPAIFLAFMRRQGEKWAQKNAERDAAPPAKKELAVEPDGDVLFTA